MDKRASNKCGAVAALATLAVALITVPGATAELSTTSDEVRMADNTWYASGDVASPVGCGLAGVDALDPIGCMGGGSPIPNVEAGISTTQECGLGRCTVDVYGSHSSDAPFGGTGYLNSAATADSDECAWTFVGGCGTHIHFTVTGCEVVTAETITPVGVAVSTAMVGYC